MMGKKEGGDRSSDSEVEDHIDGDTGQHLPQLAAAAAGETAAQHSGGTMTDIASPDEQGGQGDNVSQNDPDPDTNDKESEEAESDTTPAAGGSNRETPTGSRRASDPSSSESKYSTESLHLRKEERKSVAQLKAELAQISRRLLIEDQLADELHRRNEALYARLLQIREERQRREQFVALDDDSSDSDDPGRITPEHCSVEDYSSESSWRQQEQSSSVARARHSHSSSSDASTTTSFAGPANKKRKSEPDQDEPKEDSKPAAKESGEEQGQTTPPNKLDGIE